MSSHHCTGLWVKWTQAVEWKTSFFTILPPPIVFQASQHPSVQVRPKFPGLCKFVLLLCAHRKGRVEILGGVQLGRFRNALSDKALKANQHVRLIHTQQGWVINLSSRP
eukprot:1149237-Pelagomonas_calceolata.AAC.4